MDNWYYKCRDGSYYLGATKQELRKIWNLEEAIPHLKAMDYLIIPAQWDMYLRGGNPVFGKYVSWCNLPAIKSFGSNDSERFYMWI